MYVYVYVCICAFAYVRGAPVWYTLITHDAYVRKSIHTCTCAWQNTQDARIILIHTHTHTYTCVPENCQ